MRRLSESMNPSDHTRAQSSEMPHHRQTELKLTLCDGTKIKAYKLVKLRFAV